MVVGERLPPGERQQLLEDDYRADPGRRALTATAPPRDAAFARRPWRSWVARSGTRRSWASELTGSRPRGLDSARPRLRI
jgi:hypothetical protein